MCAERTTQVFRGSLPAPPEQMREAMGCSASRLGSIEEDPVEKGTRLLRSSVEPLLLLSCVEHAPHLFCKLGKDLGQNAVGSTVAIRSEERRVGKEC